MIIIGLARGLFLLFDPYNEADSLPSPLAYMLMDLGYPCVTSAFAILFLALLRVTQVELLSPSVQTPKALAVFCCIHLAISLALDITPAENSGPSEVCCEAVLCSSIGFEQKARQILLECC